MLYNFTLHAKRMKIGEDEFINQYFGMELLETLIPPPVEQINVIMHNSTTNDATVALKLSSDLEKISNHLKFNIMLKALDESETLWSEHVLVDLQTSNNMILIPLDDLKFAYTTYQLKVRTKSRTSLEVHKMWSDFKEYEFRTIARLPEMTPKICKNCFNVMDNGNIFVYWSDVPRFYQNGENFEYELRMKNARGRELKRIRQFKTSFMLTKSLSDTLTIELYSTNHLGSSSNFSSIQIAHQNEKFVKIKKELLSDFGYKLSWKLLNENILVESFTVLWCRQIFELPNQCDSSISFTHIPRDQMEFFMNTSDSIQFGIALNNEFSTGFEWAECTASRPDGTYRKGIIILNGL